MDTELVSVSRPSMKRGNKQIDRGNIPRKLGHIRLRLLRAARLLLSEAGTEGATARAICDKVGVSAPTLYYHFGDLQRLHSAAVNAAFMEIMVGYRRQSRAEGAVAAIRQAWAAFLQFADSEPRLARLLINAVLDGRMPSALRLTLWQLRKDLIALEGRGDLCVSSEEAVSMLWMAAVGAVSMSSRRVNDQLNIASAPELLLGAVLGAIESR